MDGTQKKSKFPKFDFIPPSLEEESESDSQPIAIITQESQEKESNEESQPWPKEDGFLPASILLSVNGGATYRPLGFNFVVYKSSMSSLECSHDLTMSTGGLELQVGLKGSVRSIAMGEEEEKGEEGEEEGEKGEEDGDVRNGEEETKEGEDGGDGFGLGLKKIDVDVTSTKWLFPSKAIKIRFKGGSTEGGNLIDESVQGVYDDDMGSITCVVPAMKTATEWFEWVKLEKAKDPEEVAAAAAKAAETSAAADGEEPAEASVVVPRRPSMVDVDLLLAMDGVTYEKIGTITMMPPPVIDSIVTEEEGASPGSQLTIVGSGFGVDGTSVHILVSHISSGNDFSCKGKVVDGEDGEGDTQSIIFEAPAKLLLEADMDEISYHCLVEISLDGTTLTDWGTTFVMAPAPPAE